MVNTWVLLCLFPFLYLLIAGEFCRAFYKHPIIPILITAVYVVISLVFLLKLNVPHSLYVPSIVGAFVMAFFSYWAWSNGKELEHKKGIKA